jgi:DNA-directed RNA polymerase specialized sigma24 family protein
MNKKEILDEQFWKSVKEEEDKKERNQSQVFYRHNRPFESMGEQNVIDQSSIYENSVVDSKFFNEYMGFLDILENQKLFKSLKKLKKLDMDIIVLRYRYGQEFKDIAKKINIMNDSVKKRHIRVLAKLKIILEK